VPSYKTAQQNMPDPFVDSDSENMRLYFRYQDYEAQNILIMLEKFEYFLEQPDN
jgi:hypothetical protein